MIDRVGCLAGLSALGLILYCMISSISFLKTYMHSDSLASRILNFHRLSLKYPETTARTVCNTRSPDERGSWLLVSLSPFSAMGYASCCHRSRRLSQFRRKPRLVDSGACRSGMGYR
ncbi:hypothetical protein MPTK1_5g12860 [Marchantia polymorpha subsp. ruderalis]|uniref:Uncharacterized protein n=2 Tax=Marchantia polymorpha TaxID=3197 RepID=A0AAF6BHR6_MARPO|nr:hypothetical protein MARPO_0092s0022 [Marchantia polymorpha]BBN11550.1 hypothetical protein Mp_5g12860 [Marchantia polymorpha subsp. ruderalis]|eukprot:PTQ33051.1 hypothetical protein MARPO_0092s0022 [Marchantia polymorpha]